MDIAVDAVGGMQGTDLLQAGICTRLSWTSHCEERYVYQRGDRKLEGWRESDYKAIAPLPENLKFERLNFPWLEQLHAAHSLKEGSV